MAAVSNGLSALNIVTDQTKLRHLKLKSWSRVVEVLSVSNRWLEVARQIKKPDDQQQFLYTTADISTLENQKKYGTAPAEAFLQHWSTSGAKQPTVGDLIDLLIDAHLYQAADIVSSELLQTPVSSNITSGLGTASDYLQTMCNIDTCGTVKCDQNENQDNAPLKEPTPCEEHPNKELDIALDSMQKYEYHHLSHITSNFCNIPVFQGGCKIGEGAFGVVYRACSEGQWVAVKKLKDAVDNQFLNELDVLSEYKHENLLPLLGYSNDGPYCCLVYLFMLNGSLQERLACMDNSEPIPWVTRISIAFGTAMGIHHLHNFKSEPRIHRDIKSANILLDENFIPKLGDFGLARIGKSSTTTSVAFTTNVYGTTVYMPREAFNGEVSVKLDSFSYGVVLLELLTGLPPHDGEREETDLTSFVNENYGSPEDIVTVLDCQAGNWDHDIAISLYEVSKLCTVDRRKKRCTIDEVLPKLELLSKQVESLEN